MKRIKIEFETDIEVAHRIFQYIINRGRLIKNRYIVTSFGYESVSTPYRETIANVTIEMYREEHARRK